MKLDQVLHKDYDGPINVKNITRGKLRGRVLFNVSEPGTGQPIPIQVDDTFLPKDLMEDATKKQLAESRDFRRAITRGFLELVDETEANEIRSRSGARQEMSRLRKRADVTNAMHNASFGGATESVALGSSNEDQVQMSGIHPRLWGLPEKVAADGEMGAINVMRGVIDELSSKDLKYVRRVARERSFSRVLKYATNALRSKRKA